MENGKFEHLVLLVGYRGINDGFDEEDVKEISSEIVESVKQIDFSKYTNLQSENCRLEVNNAEGYVQVTSNIKSELKFNPYNSPNSNNDEADEFSNEWEDIYWDFENMNDTTSVTLLPIS